MNIIIEPIEKMMEHSSQLYIENFGRVHVPLFTELGYRFQQFELMVVNDVQDKL